jgi:hypothetical protein
MLAGVNTGDVTGSGFTQLMQMRMPTGPNSGQRLNFQGLPGPVDGRAPEAPRNGLLNVSLPCLQVMGNWPSFPHTVQTTFGSYWSQASLGTHLIRQAVCQTPGCLDWTFLPAPGDAVQA